MGETDKQTRHHNKQQATPRTWEWIPRSWTRISRSWWFWSNEETTLTTRILLTLLSSLDPEQIKKMDRKKKQQKKMGRTKKKHCADKKKGLFHKKTLSRLKKIFKKRIVNRENAPH